MIAVRSILFSVLVYTLPFLVGSLYKNRSLSFTFLAGQLTMWAAFQLVAVPAIHLRASFTALGWIYSGVALVLAAIGMRNRIRIGFDKPEISVYLILAVLVIGFQMYKYIFEMHLDEDDARWLAEANDALVKDKMLLHNPATGEYIGRFVGEMIKDAFSPWAFYVAWLSGATGIMAAAVAHTIYPPILLLTCYCAYYEIGRQLFSKKTERGIFLLMVAVINLFMGGNGYTQASFTLVRIWQGKAVVAAVLIPSILMCALLVQNEDKVKNWLLLAVCGCAGCLLSGMGIAVGLIMIAVYGGYAMLCRRWKRIPLWLLAMVPAVVYGWGYFALKG